MGMVVKFPFDTIKEGGKGTRIDSRIRLFHESGTKNCWNQLSIINSNLVKEDKIEEPTKTRIIYICSPDAGILFFHGICR